MARAAWLVVPLCMGTAVAQSPPEEAEVTAVAQGTALTDQVQAIIDEYDSKMNAFYVAYQAAKGEEARDKLYAEAYPSSKPYAKRLSAIVKQAPEAPAALNAILWILGNADLPDQRAEFMNVLLDHHMATDGIGKACQAIARDPSIATENFLVQVMKTSKTHGVVGQATFALSSVLNRRMSIVKKVAKQTEGEAADLRARYGEELIKLCETTTAEELFARRKQLLETVRDKYGDVPRWRSTLGESAKGELFEMEHLQVGMVAPDIQGDDLDGVDFKLSDYRGKVVFLDFWGDW